MIFEEIRIGALYPITGDNQYVGESIRKALEFYVNLINNQNIYQCHTLLKLPYLGGRKIKLIWGDTQGDPMVALSEARRLVLCEGVTSIIGSYQSTVTSAVSLLTEVLGVPYVSPDTDAGILTKRGLKWFFKTGTDDGVYTESLFSMLIENGFCHSTIGSLAENSLLGQGEVQAVIDLSYKYRYDITSLELYSSVFPDIKSKLKDIKYINPNFIFTGQLPKDAVETLKSLKEINYYPMALLDQTSDYTLQPVLETVGKESDYVISAVPWAVGLTDKILLANQVNCMFKNIYGEDFNAVNSASFTGIYVLIDAIGRIGINTPSEIRRALIETNIPEYELIMPWKGVVFDKNGRNIYANSIVVQIFNSKLQIVWPRELAEANVIIPVPQWNMR